MSIFVCNVCGWEYDEEKGYPEFEDLPDDFVCPLCHVGKDMFDKQ